MEQNERDPLLMQHFWDLASVDEKVRLSAAEKLVQSLLAAQQSLAE